MFSSLTQGLIFWSMSEIIASSSHSWHFYIITLQESIQKRPKVKDLTIGSVAPIPNQRGNMVPSEAIYFLIISPFLNQ